MYTLSGILVEVKPLASETTGKTPTDFGTVRI